MEIALVAEVRESATKILRRAASEGASLALIVVKGNLMERYGAVAAGTGATGGGPGG